MNYGRLCNPLSPSDSTESCSRIAHHASQLPVSRPSPCMSHKGNHMTHAYLAYFPYLRLGVATFSK